MKRHSHPIGNESCTLWDAICSMDNLKAAHQNAKKGKGWYKDCLLYTSLEKGQVGLLEGNGAEAVVPLEKNTGWIRKVANQIHDFVLETKDTSKDFASDVASTGFVTTLKTEVAQRISNLEMVVVDLVEMLKEMFPQLLDAFDVTIVLDDGTLAVSYTHLDVYKRQE